MTEETWRSILANAIKNALIVADELEDLKAELRSINRIRLKGDKSAPDTLDAILSVQYSIGEMQTAISRMEAMQR